VWESQIHGLTGRGVLQYAPTIPFGQESLSMRSASQKIGVVLFNLGGPDSLEAVKPYLYNLFQDPDIFSFPLSALVRKPLAYLIASLRARKSRVYFEAIGGKSPLKELTLGQAEVLEKILNAGPPSPWPSPVEGEGKIQKSPSPLEGEGWGEGENRFKVLVAMRYWTPSTDEAILELKQEGIQKVILLPLYPHYSYTTTRSSERYWKKRCKKLGVSFEKEILIRDYHDHPDYIRSLTARIEEALENFSEQEKREVHLLFSAHSIPLKEIKNGDPYPKQIQKSMELVLQALGYPHPSSLSYQSKVGPLKWLEPSTAETIQVLAHRGVKSVLVVPISFVSDHSETLYELKKLYGDLARKVGIQKYEVMPALNQQPFFIQALRNLVLTGCQTF